MIKALLFDFGRVITEQKPQSLFERYESELDLLPGTLNSIMFESPFWEKALVGDIEMQAYWQAIGPQLKLFTVAEVEAFQKRYGGRIEAASATPEAYREAWRQVIQRVLTIFEADIRDTAARRG